MSFHVLENIFIAPGKCENRWKSNEIKWPNNTQFASQQKGFTFYCSTLSSSAKVFLL